MRKLGLIAGGGVFPLLVAKEATEAGCDVYAVALRGEANSEVEQWSHKMIWVKLGELDKMTRFFEREAVHEAIMAGYVRKPKILSGDVRPDLSMLKVMTSVRDWKDKTLLSALSDHLEKKGVRLLDSTIYLRDSLPAVGILSKSKPSKSEREDIRFGFGMAKHMAELDIGQTVVVKDRCVVAVESIEGTDETIRRGGCLATQGATVVKVARPHQDMRFDVPAIGLETLKTAIESRVRVIAVEAEKTILFEKEALVKLADEKKLCLVAVDGRGEESRALAKELANG